MAPVDPELILRLGSHAEKDYIEKTLSKVSALIVGANLMESTPGATSSLIFRCSTEQTPRVPVYLDPMTYAFGPYADPATGDTRTDLDWIKSEQKVKGRGTERRFKKSYVALAAKYGGLFEAALERSQSISLRDLGSPAARRATAESVVEYQLTRAKSEFEKEPEFAAWAENTKPPPAVFAPYFYVEPRNAKAWLQMNMQLAHDAVIAADTRCAVHALLCLDATFLADDDFVETLATRIRATGVAAVWLWFSKFSEDAAATVQLRTYRELVEKLTTQGDVFSLHGGFFSLALSRVGLRGISHGVGYGEQKDVMPVIGQSTPTVRYYVPPLRVRTGVVEIERSFGDLGIRSPADFFEKICDCVICRGTIGSDLNNFATRFGAKHYSTPSSKRQAQTPEAAKLCRFHFLLCRFKERDWVRGATLEDIRTVLADAYAVWGVLPAFQSDRPDHLQRWHTVLG